MNKEHEVLTDDELDAIGEILNISMGAAATAVSTMLERQVVITTPLIGQSLFKNVDYTELEPAVVVKIKYIQGLTGSNVIVIRRKDLGVILDLLMGNDLSPSSAEYEFDDMSMSAASEVMNQMMGASATALSEILSKTINISTPQAMLVNSSSEANSFFDELEADDKVVSVSFKMTIKETLDTTFSCIMPLELTREIVRSVNGEIEEEPTPVPQPIQAQQPSPMPQPPPTPQTTMPQPTQAQQPPPMQQPAAMPQPMYQPQLEPPQKAYPYQHPYQQPVDPNYQQMQYQQPYAQPPYGAPPYGQYPYGQYNPYQDPQQTNARHVAPSVNVKQAEFPEFAQKNSAIAANSGSNLNMLMGVQLEVSVVIGRTKQKIKDVLEYGQGTVIELDKQTGAPAEIVVNGQLLAYGDVVVVGDNFGIRITEIVGTKELFDSLEKNNKHTL